MKRTAFWVINALLLFGFAASAFARLVDMHDGTIYEAEAIKVGYRE